MVEGRPSRRLHHLLRRRGFQGRFGELEAGGKEMGLSVRCLQLWLNGTQVTTYDFCVGILIR